MSQDGANMGIGVGRSLETVVGGKDSPEKGDGVTKEEMREQLLAKDDNIDGYDSHAQVMAKYILLALSSKDRKIHNLHEAPVSPIMYFPNKDSMDGCVVVCNGLSDILKDHIYQDEDHPFRKALSEATGFTWGWAVNAARYAMGLPSLRNPAIMEIG